MFDKRTRTHAHIKSTYFKNSICRVVMVLFERVEFILLRLLLRLLLLRLLLPPPRTRADHRLIVVRFVVAVMAIGGDGCGCIRIGRGAHFWEVGKDNHRFLFIVLVVVVDVATTVTVVVGIIRVTTNNTPSVSQSNVYNCSGMIRIIVFRGTVERQIRLRRQG
jgi:hypothetical protein